MKFGSHNFRHVVLYDLEFATPQGELQVPVCLVAHDLVTGQTIRIWEDELRRLKAPPFPFGGDTLAVSYYAIAELSCHIALHWPLPEYILDLCVEFKCLTNCLRPKGFGGTLLDALNWYGLDGLSVVEKESMRELAQRGGPWTEEEKKSLLDYCETDVVALKKLLPKMLPQLDVERALYRGH